MSALNRFHTVPKKNNCTQKHIIQAAAGLSIEALTLQTEIRYTLHQTLIAIIHKSRLPSVQGYIYSENKPEIRSVVLLRSNHSFLLAGFAGLPLRLCAILLIQAFILPGKQHS